MPCLLIYSCTLIVAVSIPYIQSGMLVAHNQRVYGSILGPHSHLSGFAQGHIVT